MKKVIITGANGFIGRNVVKCLLERGIEVHAFIFPYQEKEEIWHEHLELLHTYFLPLEKIDEIPNMIKDRDVDCFYHFAWDGVYEPKSLDYKVQLFNMESTCRAIEVCSKIGCKRFVYPSSVMEFDCMRSTITSDKTPLNRRTTYYGAKIGAYLLSKHLATQLGVDYIQAIISNIYGPTLNQSFITSTLIKFIKGEHVAFTSGEQFYDFVHIDDAAVMMYYIGAEGKPMASYYIGSDSPKKLKYFIMEMRDCVDPSIELNLGEVKTNVVDMPINLFDTQKLAQETKYRQKISFREGIMRTIKFLKENLNI